MHLTMIEVRARKGLLFRCLRLHLPENADDLKIIAIIFGSVYMLITAIEVRNTRLELIRAKRLTYPIGIWSFRRSDGEYHLVVAFHPSLIQCHFSKNSQLLASLPGSPRSSPLSLQPWV